MKGIYLQYFAAVFTVLLVCDNVQAGVKWGVPHREKKPHDEKQSGRYPSVALPSNDLISLDAKTYVRSDKRSLGAVLIGVSAISAGADIYKQEAGCTLHAPNLNSNYEKITELHDYIIETTTQINSDWVPITESENYFDLLFSNLGIIREYISKLDVLKLDILSLLDVSIRTNLDLTTTNIENEILVYNSSDYSDPDYLVAKYFSDTAYALSLSLKLIPVGFYLGSKLLATTLGKQVSGYMTKKLITDHPNTFTRMIQRFNENGLFPNTRARFNNFLANSPRYQAFKAKLSLGPKTKAFWNNHKTLLTRLGKGAVAGLFLGYEAYLIWKFDQDCKAKEAESYKLLDELNDTKQNLTWVRGNMTELSDAFQGNYTDMLAELQSWEFALLVEETRNMTLLAQNQPEDQIVAAANFSIFLNGINNTVNVIENVATINYTYAGYLVDTLLYAFGSAGSTLECYRRKLAVLTSMTTDCETGANTMDNLWTAAKALEGQTLEDCIINDQYLSEAEVKEVVKGYMDDKSKQEICIRNSVTVKQTVCAKWADYSQTVASIVVSTENVDTSDVNYFIGICDAFTITDTQKTTICLDKKNNATVADCTTKFSRHQSSDITTVFNECLFDSDQTEDVCEYKKYQKGYDYTYSVFPYYDQTYVKGVYDACVITMDENDESNICVNSEWFTDATHGIYANYVKIYGVDTVQATIDKCIADKAAAGDESEDLHHRVLNLRDEQAKKAIYHHLKKQVHLTKKDEKHRMLLAKLEDIFREA